MTPGADESEDNLEASLELPTGSNPRTRELAAEWRREHEADEAVVRQVLGHFRREAFVYTLNPPLLGQNGIDEFLFETRRGFCEHYAGAFVFLMRAAGIPARVVTGYQGGEPNPIDGYLIVRQSDAHAWAEIWLSGQGWVRIDPTAAIAPSRIEMGLAAAVPEGELLPFLARGNISWLRDVRFRWEAMNNSWNQWVLGYNPERQRELLSRLGLREPDWRSMSATLTALCGFLMLAYAAWALHQRIRVDAALRAWNRLSRKLARLGLARRPWEGPADYARRVALAQPKLEIDIQRIAALYIALRYGGWPKPPHDERTTSPQNGVGNRGQLLREMNQSISGLNVGTSWTI
jgi:transglutaminase-like putative cysteine protease